MSDQVRLHAEPRERRGKGASGRLRREGRVPAILYGYEVEPAALSVDALDLYHTLHTEAGANVLIRLEVGGETYLSVARDLQWHPVRGDTMHVDFLAVDRDAPISVEVPVHVLDEEEITDAGVVNQILYTAPMLVKPLDVPNYLETSVAGMGIGDVLRVSDLTGQLPQGAEFDIDLERTVVTVNAPVSEAELEALEEGAGVEGEAPAAEGEDAAGDDEVAAEEEDLEA